MKKHYDVVIIGAGISGSALFYAISNFSNIKSVLILEKYDKAASLNSNAKSNSQTIHCGDIETNYSLKQAKKVKQTSSLLKQYAKNNNYEDINIFKYPKMVLGVGDEQVDYIKKRHNELSELFPYMDYWDKEKLNSIEPYVCKDRKENISALGCLDDYCAIDYGLIAKSFIENGQKSNNNADVLFNYKVASIKKENNIYEIKGGGDNKGEDFIADFVLVNAGAHSLVFAHSMGYGGNYSAIPMGGNYYFLNQPLLKSKIYTIQNPKLPFAAIHADPDIGIDSKEIRLGPTAFPLMFLERYKKDNKISEFLNSLDYDNRLLKSMYILLKDKDIRNFIIRNITYEIPYLGKKTFLKQAQKIIPSLKLNDIYFAEQVGGLRPQIIDKRNYNLLFSEANINHDDGIIFNMTPSPGATSCLGNAIKDLKFISTYLNKEFYENKFNELLKPEEDF